MTVGRARRASVATIVAALAIGLAATGCGRLADRGDADNNPAVSAETSQVDGTDVNLDEIGRLLDDADAAVSGAEQDADEGERSAGVGDEP